MVSVPQVEYSIHPTLAILNLVGIWKVMYVMVDAIMGLIDNW